jgi:serine/threonine protein kinase/Flp pilus assembly protein TadD
MSETIDDNQKDRIKKAVQDFIDAQLEGHEPDIDQFVKQYPHLEHQIKQSIRDMQRINTLFDSLVQADESDFENAAAGQNLVGKKIGGFEITEVIGSGGMGIVYLARDTRLDRLVAIKSIPVKQKESSATQIRFKREAKLLASLNHPNIAVIYEILEQDESGYLILEYVPGETLTERIAREPLTLEEALSIGKQIARAVSAAHKKGIVHRDLKPGNIKITPEGQIKVLDFGLAKPLMGEDKRSDIAETQPGRIIGTPAYMSPEQARGKDTDHRTDIWSFGCIMYQMLTGQLPFEGQTATDTLARIIEREPNWELLPEETPENIRKLLRHCLEKNLDKRLDNIADITVQISDTLSKPIPAPAVSTRLRRVMWMVGASIIIVLLVATLCLLPEKQAQPSPKEIRLVVLPFDNLGPTEDEWFVDGMTDEITGRLAGIHDLGVISRQSAIQYKNKGKNTPQIAEELDVDYILEGTIQRENPSDQNSRVRIRCQLIRTTDDTHVWTEQYDDNMIEVLSLQSQIAEMVAQALDLTLLEPERKLLASRPTKNTEAFNLYLQSKNYTRRSGLENYKEIAIEMLKKAIELDPNFTLAYVGLSHSYAGMYWDYEDRSEECLARAEQAARKALKLDPDLPESHVAMARYYYQGHMDFDNALKHLEIVRKSYPNHEGMLYWTGNIRKRQGKFQLAVDNLEKAFELNPLSSNYAVELGVNYLPMRKYPESEYYYNKAISLAPHLPGLYSFKAWLYLCWNGNTERARKVLEEGLQKSNDKQNYLQNYLVNTLLVTIDIFEEKYQEALNKLSLKPEDVDELAYFIPYDLRCALIYMFMNNKELAQKHFEKAQVILEDKIKQQPGDDRYYSALGISYAGLGRKEEAVEMGQEGAEKLPFTEDGGRVQSRYEDLARIFVMIGDFDAAIDKLEFLLNMDGDLSISLLRLDPAWDPLRDHPRFKKLIEKGIKN